MTRARRDESPELIRDLQVLSEALRRSRLELTRTIDAVRRGYRTPDQIRAVLQRARAVLHRSISRRRRRASVHRPH